MNKDCITPLAAAFALLTCLTSCKDNSGPNMLMPMNARSMSVLSLETELPNLEIDNSQVRNIQIPLNDNDYDFYQLIESINYVPLETNAESLLGHIDKIVTDDNFLFILDKQNELAMRFTKDGKYLGRIGKQGNNKGEYESIADLSIDYRNKRICLLDPNGAQQLFYDYGGNLVKEQPLYYYYQQIEFAGDTQIQHTGFSFNEEAPQLDYNRVVIANAQQQPLYVGFPYDEKLRSNFHWSVSRPLHSVRGKVFFNHILSNTIWQIEGNKAIARYKVELPSNCTSQDQLNISTLSDKEFETKTEKSPITYKGGSQQTDNTLCVFITKEGFIRPVLYNKSSGNVLKGTGFKNAQHNLFESLSANIFDFSDGENFIKVLQPFDIFRIMKLNKNIKPSEKEKVLLNNITEESNPILVFVKLKNF
jgi:hypothetical protein